VVPPRSEDEFQRQRAIKCDERTSSKDDGSSAGNEQPLNSGDSDEGYDNDGVSGPITC